MTLIRSISWRAEARGWGKPFLAVTLLLPRPSRLCAAKGDSVRIFLNCGLSLLATHTHTHTQLFSQVLGGKLGRKKRQRDCLCVECSCVWCMCMGEGVVCKRAVTAKRGTNRAAFALTPEEKTTEPL